MPPGVSAHGGVAVHGVHPVGGVVLQAQLEEKVQCAYSGDGVVAQHRHARPRRDVRGDLIHCFCGEMRRPVPILAPGLHNTPNPRKQLFLYI